MSSQHGFWYPSSLFGKLWITLAQLLHQYPGGIEQEFAAADIMKLIDSAHSTLLARAMDGYSLRQRVTASNIAHADTPGYIRKEVRFEEALQRASERGGAKAMSEVTPTIEWTDRKVELEDELLEMSDTQVRVHLTTRALRHHFDLMRSGITGINR